MIAMLMITMLILEHKGRPPHPTQASGSDPLEKMFAQSLFHYFLCVFQKLGIFWVINAQCLVSSVLNMCTRFPYIALNFTPKCWIEAGGQCWTWEQIGGGWLVGMPMTKMPKSRDSHNATRRSHNAMWARDNSRNMMRSKLQATSQAPWEAKREADVSIQSLMDDIARPPYFYQFPCLKGLDHLKTLRLAVPKRKARLYSCVFSLHISKFINSMAKKKQKQKIKFDRGLQETGHQYTQSKWKPMQSTI